MMHGPINRKQYIGLRKSGRSQLWKRKDRTTEAPLYPERKKAAGILQVCNVCHLLRM